MKKFISLMLVICSVFILIGCSNSEVKTLIMNCNITINDENNNFKTVSDYNIYYNDDIVEKLKIVESIISDDENVLSTFETSFNNTYQTMKEEYGGCTYKITTTDNKVTNRVTIDYDKMDLEKFAIDQPDSEYMLNEDNKVSLKKLIATYKTMGGTCE